MAEGAAAGGTWRFSSDDFPEERRLNLFRETLEPVLPFAIEPVHGARFFNAVTLMALPGLDAAVGISEGAVFHRTRPLTRQSDDLTLCVTRDGRSRISQRGVDMVMEDGDAFLGAADLVSTSGPIEGAVGCLTLRLPRQALAASVLDVEAAFVRPIRRGTEALRLLAGYMGVVRQAADSGSIGVQRLVASHVQDLVALALGETAEAGEIARGRAARRAAAGDQGRRAGPSARARPVGRDRGSAPGRVAQLCAQAVRPDGNQLFGLRSGPAYRLRPRHAAQPPLLRPGDQRHRL